MATRFDDDGEFDESVLVSGAAGAARGGRPRRRHENDDSEEEGRDAGKAGSSRPARSPSQDAYAAMARLAGVVVGEGEWGLEEEGKESPLLTWHRGASAAGAGRSASSNGGLTALSSSPSSSAGGRYLGRGSHLPPPPFPHPPSLVRRYGPTYASLAGLLAAVQGTGARVAVHTRGGDVVEGTLTRVEPDLSLTVATAVDPAASPSSSSSSSSTFPPGRGRMGVGVEGRDVCFVELPEGLKLGHVVHRHMTGLEIEGKRKGRHQQFTGASKKARTLPQLDAVG